jgi:hypothetical protein
MRIPFDVRRSARAPFAALATDAVKSLRVKWVGQLEDTTDIAIVGGPSGKKSCVCEGSRVGRDRADVTRVWDEGVVVHPAGRSPFSLGDARLPACPMGFFWSLNGADGGVSRYDDPPPNLPCRTPSWQRFGSPVAPDWSLPKFPSRWPVDPAPPPSLDKDDEP